MAHTPYTHRTHTDARPDTHTHTHTHTPGTLPGTVSKLTGTETTVTKIQHPLSALGRHKLEKFQTHTKLHKHIMITQYTDTYTLWHTHSVMRVKRYIRTDEYHTRRAVYLLGDLMQVVPHVQGRLCALFTHTHTHTHTHKYTNKTIQTPNQTFT